MLHTSYVLELLEMNINKVEFGNTFKLSARDDPPTYMTRKDLQTMITDLFFPVKEYEFLSIQ